MPGAYLHDYGEINNGAHRKAADLIGAPSFVWHLGLWNAKQTREERVERARKLELFVLSLHAHLGRTCDNLTPPIDDIEVRYDDRVRVITLAFIWEGLRIKIRLEIHTEYLCITSIVDASLDTTDALRGLSPDSYSLHRAIRENLRKFVEGTHSADGEPPSFPDVGAVHKFVYTDLWESWFFPKLLNIEHFFDIKRDHAGTEYTELGVTFADLRGFVTCETYPPSQAARDEEDRIETKDFPKLRLEFSPIQRPFYRREEEQRGEWQRIIYPDENWARRRLDNAWAFLVLAGDASIPLLGRTEFTVSRFLDGRVLYATALGPQPKPGTSNEHPVLFYAHSVTQCERQVGRLIDRILTLETLRLAAIIPFPALKSVGQQVWDLDVSIQGTRAKIHRLIHNVRIWTKEEPEREKLERDILSNLDQVQNDMAVLSSGKEIEPSKRMGTATLEYRLIRCRYYRELFFTYIEGLRIRQIEGYQPYNEFVARRLQSAFGFIASIEARLEAVRSEWRALDQLYLTTAVTILTSEIDRAQNTAVQTQGAMKNILVATAHTQDAMRDILKHTDHVQGDIKNLQIWGEFLLTMFFIPYYLTGIGMHFLNCEYKDWCAFPAVFHTVSVEQFGALAVSLAVWIVGLFRLRTALRKRKSARSAT